MSAKNYRITDTREIQTLSQAGNTTTLYRVWIATERGATGTADVARADWKPEALAKILDERAAELDLAFLLAES